MSFFYLLCTVHLFTYFTLDMATRSTEKAKWKKWVSIYYAWKLYLDEIRHLPIRKINVQKIPNIQSEFGAL